MESPENKCPCCSDLPYAKCCKPFHKGVLPENPLQLMRSRYSAYALDKPDYIVETTHPANPQYSQDVISWKRSISQFSKNTLFKGLDILNYDPDAATVTFTAHLAQNHHDASFTEKSTFEKVGNRWLYKSGEITL